MTAPVIYSIAVSSPISPSEPLPPLPKIYRGSLRIVEDCAPTPIWSYGIALHKLHSSPVAAIAFYDPRLGATVVANYNMALVKGEVIDVKLPTTEDLA